MRTWISVYLPLLPLETIRPRWCEPGRHIVADHRQVVAASPEAIVGGIRIGMRRAGAHAICPDAKLHEYDAAREQSMLSNIALAMLQYTPEVALAEECSLLLDVSASLRAFGGRLALCRRIRGTLATLGFTSQIGMAPAAQGAWLLARYSTVRSKPLVRRTVGMETMVRHLDALPSALLPCLQPHQEWLLGIGCRTLGELRKLPRAGLGRRTGKNVLDAIDRAYGRVPELFDWVQPPLTFSAHQELPDRVDHAEGVLFAACHLIQQLVGWLVSRQLAVSCFVLLLDHERGRNMTPPSSLEIILAEPAWHAEHLTRLLKERLGHITLDAPVIAVRLESVRVAPMLTPNESLFPDSGSTLADYHRLLELLTARLGNQGVLTPSPRADHRPEVSNAWIPATSTPHSSPSRLQHMQRPFWLLEQPIPLNLHGHRPFYGSPLSMMKGPERIECGWWDEGLVIRDYFIAQDNASTCYWIYRERSGEHVHWFLQGLFG